MATLSHIVPKSYLNQFANPPNRKRGQPHLWVYQKDKDPHYRATSIQGCEKGYFAFTRPDGFVDETLESRLAELEGNCLDTLALTARTFYDLQSASRRNDLAFFAAMLFCRATQRRNRTEKLHADLHSQFAELSRNDAWIAEIAAVFEKKYGQELQPEALMRAMARLESVTEGTTALRNNFVEDLVESIEILKSFLLAKPWQLWNAPPRVEFITSDNPLISFLPVGNGELNPGHGFRKPDVIAAFPLAPHVCLSLGPANLRGPDSVTIAAERVGKINEAIIRLCDRFVYSKSRSDDVAQTMAEYGNTAKYGETAFLPIGLRVPTAKDFVLHLLGLKPSSFAATSAHH